MQIFSQKFMIAPPGPMLENILKTLRFAIKIYLSQEVWIINW